MELHLLLSFQTNCEQGGGSMAFTEIMGLGNSVVNKSIINHFFQDTRDTPISQLVESEEFTNFKLYLETNVNSDIEYVKKIETPIGIEYILSEQQGLTRLYGRMNDHSFGCLTAFRRDFSYEDNLLRNEFLIKKIVDVSSSHSFGKELLGFYKTIGYWGECSLRDIPYNECPAEKKISTYEESMIYIRNDPMDVWSFLYTMIGQGKSADQDGICIQLTADDQDIILNHQEITNKYNYSIFKEDRKNKLFNHLSDKEFESLFRSYPSPKTIYEFILDNHSTDSNGKINKPLIFLYYCKQLIDSKDGCFDKIGTDITLNNINFQFSMMRKGNTSNNLNKGKTIYSTPKKDNGTEKSTRGKITVSRLGKDLGSEEKSVNQIPFVLEGFKYPQSGTSNGYRYFKSKGILYN